MSSALKTKLIENVIKLEGGYVNDPSDSGGETNFGITKTVASASGYKGNMKDMPRQVAANIYETNYWTPLNLDSIANMAPRIAEELFDTGVNMGLTRAGLFLQRCLNALTDNSLQLDGKIGAKSIETLRGFLNERSVEGEAVLVKMLNCLQGEFYIHLCETRPKDKKFIYGWVKNRVS